MLPQAGFEPGTSHFLHTIVTDRFRVRIPARATVLFHVRFTNFSYCVMFRLQSQLIFCIIESASHCRMIQHSSSNVLNGIVVSAFNQRDGRFFVGLLSPFFLLSMMCPSSFYFKATKFHPFLI